MATAVWKGHLTFGLVSIPIRLHRAARAEKISFRQLHRSMPATRVAQQPARLDERPGDEAPPDFTKGPRLTEKAALRIAPRAEPTPTVSRVQQRLYTEASDEPLERNEIVRGYEYEPDRYVVIEKEELQAITPETARTMQILEFVQLTEIDPIYFESSYYVSPEKAGEKAYALLFEALKKSGYVALAEFAMHRRQHIVVLRPGRRGIVLHTLFYQTEVRRDDEYTADPKLVASRELDVALLLVQSMSSHFEPDRFHDTYREKLEALIAAKIEGKEVAKTAAAPPATVVDIMDALQKSLQLARKPPAAAKSSTPRKSKSRS